MNATKITLFLGAAVVIAGGLVVAVRKNQPESTADTRGAIGVVPQPSTSRELDPFTHVASIPATVDPSTIRFEKVKLVDLASKTQTSADPNCKQKQFRDPDGSNCEVVKVLERVKAVEADYSFIGPQLGTGEGDTHPNRQTFSVYFRPEELPISGDVAKLSHEQAESLFQVSSSRPIVQQKVVDQQNSRLCKGSYVDGNWVLADPNCKEQVQYTNRAVPATYWAVSVDARHPITVASR
ncbi:MAG TPA: hypothetical protein VKB79_08775 [Bryobacteraceae bacterium]|nr:hypothetical protein [Bryobacteraceae bacterium]